MEAGQDVALDLLAGAKLIEQAAKSAAGDDHRLLTRFAAILRDDKPAAIQNGLDDALAALMEKYSDRRWAVTYDKELRVNVERAKARFSTWYELFPRSCAGTPGAHGTLRDCTERLPYVAGMGFDVLYLPPIHPIGYSFRKGKNNSLDGQRRRRREPLGHRRQRRRPQGHSPAVGIAGGFQAPRRGSQKI